MAGEELLALVLEQVHEAPDSSRGRRTRRRWTLPPRDACHNAPPHMALPKEVTFVTFDVYGTLIDWETGVYDAFAKEAERDGYTLSREELIPLFHQIQQEIKGGSYELYAEVLRRTAVQISRAARLAARAVALRLPPRLGQALAAVQGDQHAARALREEVRGRADLQHRRQAARRDAPSLQGRLRPRRDRAAGALLQARSGPLQGGASAASAARRAGSTSRRATTTTSSRASRRRSRSIWVNRNKETLEPSQKKPTAEVKNLLEAAKLLGAA